MSLLGGGGRKGRETASRRTATQHEEERGGEKGTGEGGGGGVYDFEIKRTEKEFLKGRQSVQDWAQGSEGRTGGAGERGGQGSINTPPKEKAIIRRKEKDTKVGQCKISFRIVTLGNEEAEEEGGG